MTGASAHTTSETIHTTSEHPWLTTDRGWVSASELNVGEQVVRLDGGAAIVSSVRSVPGMATMYNLTVNHLHTFAVGASAYVVHNTCGPTGPDSGPKMGPSSGVGSGSSNPSPPDPGDLTFTGTSPSTGGRGGQDVPRYSTPNSYQMSSNGQHAWTYDEKGWVSWDISQTRAKQMIWNQNPAGNWFLRDGPKIPIPPTWHALFP